MRYEEKGSRNKLLSKVVDKNMEKIAVLFKERTKKSQFGDCILWTGYVDKFGYGKLHISYVFGVHQIAYTVSNGEIPKNLVVDHLCRNRCCVNTDHLRLITQKENILCGAGPTAINSRKEKCSNGHPFSEENTAIINNTKQNRKFRICRICRRANLKKWRAKQCQL